MLYIGCLHADVTCWVMSIYFLMTLMLASMNTEVCFDIPYVRDVFVPGPIWPVGEKF